MSEKKRYGQPLDDALYRQAAEAYAACNGNQSAAARMLKLARPTFMGRLNEAARKGFMDTAPVLPGYEIKKTSAQYDKNGNLEKEWVQQQPGSVGKFEVPEGHFIRGVSALTDASGQIRQQWVKTWQDKQKTQAYIDAINAAFKGWKGHAKPVKPPKRSEREYLTVYPIADQHVGLLSWGQETGENYDLKIASKRLHDCMQELVAGSRPSRQAIILNLGDWQHADDQRNMTPRSGHQLDVDGRYQKVLRVGIEMMQDCIELALQKHERVIVRNIPGNHDPHASVALTFALAGFYHREKRVTIDTDPSAWWFYRFGDNLLGATHGHRQKPADMAMAMASMRREDWGATRFHHMFFGHIHHITAKEVGDVLVESFRTIASNDAHHAAAGYSSGKSLQSITFHLCAGEKSRNRVNIIPVKV